MGVLLLVRHGQASLGTSDYDQLSELGYRQARSVGARLADADTSVHRVWCGALVRQRDTAREAMAELGIPPGDLGADDRLDEYDHVGVLAVDNAGDRFGSATTPESRHDLQSALDEAISRWIQAGAGDSGDAQCLHRPGRSRGRRPGGHARYDNGRDVSGGNRGGLRPAGRLGRRPVAGLWSAWS